MISKARASLFHGRRWALLATLLGVLALLASQNHGHGVVRNFASPVSQRIRTHTSVRSLGATQSAGMERHEATQGSLATVEKATSMPSIVHSPTTMGSPPTTTTTQPTAIATTAANLDPNIVETGWLEGPQVIEADYPLTSSSSRRATLTWSTSLPLTLSADCGAGITSSTGSSPLTIALGPGSCTVSVVGPTSVAMTSYRLEVAPT